MKTAFALLSALLLTATGLQAQIFIDNGSTVKDYNVQTGAAIGTLYTGTGMSGFTMSSAGVMYFGKSDGGYDEIDSLTATGVRSGIVSFVQPDYNGIKGLAASGSSLTWGMTTSTGTNIIDRASAVTNTYQGTVTVSGINPSIFALSSTGGTLYTLNNAGNAISTYNEATGSLLTSNLVTGLSGVNDMVVSSAGNLYVALSSGKVEEFSGSTGGVVNADLLNIADPTDLFVSGSDLYVSSYGGSLTKIAVYDAATGNMINSALVTGIGGFTGFGVIGSTIATTPEPRSWALGVLVLLALGGAAWRQKNRLSPAAAF